MKNWGYFGLCIYPCSIYRLYEIHEQPQYYTTIQTQMMYTILQNRTVLVVLHFILKRKILRNYLPGSIGYLPNDFFRSLGKRNTIANERRLVEYDIPESYAFIIQPEVEIRWENSKTNNRYQHRVLQFQGKWTYSKRNIDYTRNIYTWTTDNKQTEIISHPKQSIEG